MALAATPVRSCRVARFSHVPCKCKPPSVRTWSRKYCRHVTRAQDEGERGEDVQKDKKFEAVLDQLKKAGMTPQKAREVLKVWKDLGVQDSEQLRKLLVRKSLSPARGLALQALFDTVAAAGGFFLGNLAGQAGDLGWIKTVLSLTGYFFGCYYAIQVFLEVSAVAAILTTTAKYGKNSAQLLSAMQQLAGAGPGAFSLAEKAKLVVNSIKVMQTLDAVQELLKEVDVKNRKSTLDNLSAYLTLQRAREAFNFDPAKYNLSEEEAGDIALVFSYYDSNDNGQLESRELKSLCENLGKELNDEEIKEAVRLLDINQNGVIEFNEFVNWWTGKKLAGEMTPQG